MPPINLDKLDIAIRAALKNFSGGAIPGTKGPIINGIILNEDSLQGISRKQLAREITQAIPASSLTALKPAVKPIGDGRIIVGFQIQSKS
jgi:hypothetical protein